MKPPVTAPSWRPYVLVNMAMTADGKIATANREVSSFGSAADEQNFYRLRSTVDAVMNGARTADLNAIDMGPGGEKWRRLRKRRGLAEDNLRVIVSGSGSIDTSAHVFHTGSSPLLIITSERVAKHRLAKLTKLATDVFSAGQKEADLPAALRWLRRQWGVKRLLCEGGGALNDAMFRAGLVDELHLTICPWIIGGRTAPTIADGLGFPRLADAFQLRVQKMKKPGWEIFLTYTRLR
jgi:2,5-diamino-6-(ribosylamino)-4(3H)-pyrimidinone 5'-phosphate reductase